MARIFSLISILLTQTSFALTEGTKSFIELTGRICQTPCGVDAVKDQSERALVNKWIQKHEHLDLDAKSALVKEVCAWSKKKLSEEKKLFVQARLKERKSSLRAIFCNE